MLKLQDLLREHGGIVVLLVMGAILSLITIEDQHPTGASAGRELALELLVANPSPSVFVAADDTPSSAEFLEAVCAEVEAGGGAIVGRVLGDPRSVREALEATLDSPPDALLTLRTSDAYGLLERAPAKFPELEGSRVLAPEPYRWSTFLTRNNLLNVAEKIAVWAVLGIGMTLVILTAGIDLSVGSLVALSAVVSSLLIEQFLGGRDAGALQVVLACLAGVAASGLVGLLSGIFVTRFSVAPFIVTLGMMMAASGLALRLSGGESIDAVPDSFAWLGHGDVLGVPNAILVMLVLYGAAHVLMAHTPLGRAIYAVGGNPEAARLSGIPVGRVLIFVYVLSGLLAGVGGIITASTFESGDPNYGMMYELYVIAAVVVGGTSLAGGEGKVGGTLVGALMLGVIYNGMNLTNVGSFSQKIVLGAVILAAVVLDQWKRRRSERRA